MLHPIFSRIQKSVLPLLTVTAMLTVAPLASQNIPKKNSANWTLDQFKSRAFVENKGQYLPESSITGTPVVYGIENGVKAYLTKNGAIYELVKPDKLTREERAAQKKAITARGAEGEEAEEMEKDRILRVIFASYQWVGANTDVQISGEEQLTSYWNYLDPQNASRSIDRVPGYKKITYKNLYPNIDLQYTFHPQGGMKYALILHPGADLSKVQMKYSGADKIYIGKDGALHVVNKSGEVTDHAPVTFYQAGRGEISSQFVLDGNTVSFKLGEYDHAQTVVIDPWTVTTFNPALAPLELGRNAANEPYILGKTGTTVIVMKFDVSGNMLWSFNMTTQTTGFDSYTGDIAVDPPGNVYVSKGLTAAANTGDAKLSAAGTLIWNNGVSPWMYENWRVTFNCDYTQLINSGCGPGCCNGGRIDVLDPVTGTETGFTAPNGAGDMVCTCFGQNGFLYSINVNNGIFCLDPANSFATVYYLPVAFGLTDGIQQGSGSLGMNGIAAGCNYLYNFLGTTLDKRDPATGNLLQSVTVPNGVFLQNMGIAVDKCGNIYTGSADGVYIYDPSLTQIGYFPTGNSVTDIVLGTDGTFYACGGSPQASTGFLAQFSSPSTCTSIGSTTVGSSCQGADGSATVIPVFCSPPYTYLWSNGDTSATADSLSAGTYTVIVHGAGACNETDTATIVVPGPIALTLTQTPATCVGSNGTATATPIGGNGPYTYVWSTTPVQTTQTATGLPGGTYTVIVTDSAGCTATQTIVVQQSGTFQIATTNTNPVCFGSTTGTATATPSSGVPPYTYSWNTSPVQTTQTATGLGAGTYIVSITDSTGCITTASVTVTTPAAIGINVAATGVGCNGGNDGTATATGSGGTPGYSYSWNSSPVQTTATATGLPAGPYVVTLTDANGCTATQSVTVVEPGIPGDTLAMTGNFCPGDSVATLYAPPGFNNYQWYENNNPISGANSDSLYVPNSAGTYSVSWYLNGCIHYTTLMVLTPPFYVLNPDSVANVFTPNADGKNDFFYPFADKSVTTAQLIYYADNYSMQLFDRWGVEVFYTNDYSVQWDGQYNGKEVPDGVYYWIVTYKSRCSSDEQMTESHGFVHLIR